MAASIVNIVIGSAGRRSRDGDVPVYNAVGLASEDIATPTTSKASIIKATRSGDVCRVSPVGGAVYAAFGAAPTAAAEGVLVHDGTSFEAALEAGWTVAVIDAA